MRMLAGDKVAAVANDVAKMPRNATLQRHSAHFTRNASINAAVQESPRGGDVRDHLHSEAPGNHHGKHEDVAFFTEQDETWKTPSARGTAQPMRRTARTFCGTLKAYPHRQRHRTVGQRDKGAEADSVFSNSKSTLMFVTTPAEAHRRQLIVPKDTSVENYFAIHTSDPYDGVADPEMLAGDRLQRRVVPHLPRAALAVVAPEAIPHADERVARGYQKVLQRPDPAALRPGRLHAGDGLAVGRGDPAVACDMSQLRNNEISMPTTRAAAVFGPMSGTVGGHR